MYVLICITYLYHAITNTLDDPHTR